VSLSTKLHHQLQRVESLALALSRIYQSSTENVAASSCTTSDFFFLLLFFFLVLLRTKGHKKLSTIVTGPELLG